MPFLITTQSLDRKEAIRRINLIVGKDLRAMADEYKIAVWRNSRENKGWAGQVIERYLGLPQNSRQAPDFGDWELKVVPLRKDTSGNLRVKESMAITMLEPAEVVANNFEDSHLYDKLRSMVVVSRVWESKEELRSRMERLRTTSATWKISPERSFSMLFLNLRLQLAAITDSPSSRTFITFLACCLLTTFRRPTSRALSTGTFTVRSPWTTRILR